VRNYGVLYPRLAVLAISPKETEMKKYLIAAVLIGSLAAPALAVETGGGKYFVGLDTTTKKCSVVTEMAPGMKMMGEYDTKEAAEAAMATMAECKG
jgi:hypothetical protein